MYLVLHGLDLESEHCIFENLNGTVNLIPLNGAQCSVNGIQITEATHLNQGITWHNVTSDIASLFLSDNSTEKNLCVYKGVICLFNFSSISSHLQPKMVWRAMEILFCQRTDVVKRKNSLLI